MNLDARTKDLITKKKAFVICKEFQEKALAVKSGKKVGACIIGESVGGSTKFYGGSNIEISSEVRYHAEIVALIKCLQDHFKPIVVCATSDSDEEDIALCLGCRDKLYHVNPDIIICIYNPDGTIKTIGTVEDFTFRIGKETGFDWDTIQEK